MAKLLGLSRPNRGLSWRQRVWCALASARRRRARAGSVVALPSGVLSAFGSGTVELVFNANEECPAETQVEFWVNRDGTGWGLMGSPYLPAGSLEVSYTDVAAGWPVGSNLYRARCTYHGTVFGDWSDEVLMEN